MANPNQERYVPQRKLGGGGMGEVWLATDTLLNRPVALKYLIANDKIHKDFFLSEARTLASLNHPNITFIYDAKFDPKQDAFYLVMEYVEGQSLANLLERWSGPLPAEIVLDVMNGVLQALQYAHEKGIVHRDIKPANVMLQKEGVKLTDFGIAGLISLLSEGADYLVGTPAYMSPEQIDGHGLDGRADLYSLGVMLFEMLSGGQLPFSYDRESEIFEAHLSEPPPPLRQLSPEVHPALEHTDSPELSGKEWGVTKSHQKLRFGG
jgi:serine/threonine-protein kinase